MVFSLQTVYHPIMTTIGMSEDQTSFTQEGTIQHGGLYRFLGQLMGEACVEPLGTALQPRESDPV